MGKKQLSAIKNIIFPSRTSESKDPNLPAQPIVHNASSHKSQTADSAQVNNNQHHYPQKITR